MKEFNNIPFNLGPWGDKWIIIQGIFIDGFRHILSPFLKIFFVLFGIIRVLWFSIAFKPNIYGPELLKLVVNRITWIFFASLVIG